MSKPPIGEKMDKPNNPRWETAILILSFVAIWVWWLARQNAYRAQTEFSGGWTALLLVFVALLVWVFVRRLTRTMAAIRELKR